MATGERGREGRISAPCLLTSLPSSGLSNRCFAANEVHAGERNRREARIANDTNFPRIPGRFGKAIAAR